MSKKKVIATVRYVDGGKLPPRRIELDDICDEATEMDILASACRVEGWRVNKDTEERFAEKPCPNAGIEDVPDTNIWRRCYTHEEKLHCPCCCNGTLFVRAGGDR